MLSEIPLVGQPYTLKNWFVTVEVQCNCVAKEPVLIVGQLGSAGKCPACNNVYRMDVVETNRQSGQMGFGITVGRAVVEPKSPLAV